MKRIKVIKKTAFKHAILLMFVLMFSLPAAAGDKTDTVIIGNNTKKQRSVSFKEIKINGRRKYYPTVFLDFGYDRLGKTNMFTGSSHESAADFPRLRNSASKSFAIYSMCRRKLAGPLSMMTGMGVDWTNYRFSHDVTIKEINGVVMQTPLRSVINNYESMKQSKYMLFYFHIPLFLRIDQHKFFFAAGVTGGLNMGSNTKVVFTDANGKKHKYKDYDINPATFRYGYALRAGFRCISVFANYYVSPLFAGGEGPQVYPFTVGISLKLE
jgi:hypothetical protein